MGIDKLALGTAQLGSNYGIANKTGQPSQNVATQIIRSAISAGIKNIDTARAYGTSENIIGDALKSLDRSNITISTKLSPHILDNTSDIAVINGRVDQSIEESLNALNSNKLDVVMLHRWHQFSDNNNAVWQRLISWQNRGVINKLGASLSCPSEVLAALKVPEVEFIQFAANILDWRYRSGDISNAIANRKGVVIQVRSAFLQGILISPPQIWPECTGVDVNQLVSKLDMLVDKLNMKNKADLCIAYLRSLDWISNIVVGMESLDQLEENINLFQNKLLSKQEIELIEESFVNYPETLLNPALWNRK